jgi:hypothetical protein
MKTQLDIELPLIRQIVEIAHRRERRLPEEHAGEDLLRLAEIIVQLNNPANARRLAALTWGAYRTPDDENRAGVIFGFVRFSRLMQVAAVSEQAADQESIPPGFRM